MNYIDKLKSRKFQMILGGILVALGSMMTGEISAFNGLISIVVLVLGYVGVEGSIDYASAHARVNK